MALGFSTGSSFGSRTIIPDKGMSRSNEHVIFKAEFGDGYQQRIANGINNLKQQFSVSFATREKAEIDEWQRRNSKSLCITIYSKLGL